MIPDFQRSISRDQKPAVMSNKDTAGRRMAFENLSVTHEESQEYTDLTGAATTGYWSCNRCNCSDLMPE